MQCSDMRRMRLGDTITVAIDDGESYRTVDIKLEGPDGMVWGLNLFFPSNVEREAFLRQCAALLPAEVKEASDGG